MSRKILFFSAEVGIAHLTRSLAIAQELQKRKVDVAFAVPKLKQDIFKKHHIQTFDVAPFLQDGDLDSAKKLLHPNKVESLVRSEIDVINKYKPDTVIVDFRPSALVATAITQKKTYYLTGSGGLPSCYIPSLGYPQIFHNFIQLGLQQLVQFAKKPYFDGLEKTAQKLTITNNPPDIFSKLEYLVPEYFGYLPNFDKRLKIHYVGPIFWPEFEKEVPQWLKTIKPDGKTVYLTFGGTGFDGKKLVSIATTLINQGWKVVVSSSSVAKPEDFPRHNRLFVTKYISGMEICKRVDAVVCHGGYGTMMQAFLNNKPVVAIPFNHDQLLHSLRIQELGLGKCITNINLADIFGFQFNKMQLKAGQIPETRIVAALDHVVNNNIIRKNCNHFVSQSHNYYGATQAADIIMRRLHKV